MVDRTQDLHFGIHYDDIVRIVRAQLPASVDFIIDDVRDIQTGPQTQRVSLASHGAITPDLIILATGVAELLRHKAGIGRRIVAERQSISFGFTLAPGAQHAPEFEALVYYGAGAANRIDYLSLFPIGELLRANLFTFLDHDDPWICEFRLDPMAGLFDALPGVLSGRWNWPTGCRIGSRIFSLPKTSPRTASSSLETRSRRRAPPPERVSLGC